MNVRSSALGVIAYALCRPGKEHGGDGHSPVLARLQHGHLVG